MDQDRSDDFVDSVVLRDMVDESGKFGPDDIEFIRRNPDVLAKLADPLEIKKRYLYVLFVVAVLMAATAKIVEYTKALESNYVLNDLASTVLFAISIELFGAAVVAFLLELVFEKRIQKNRELMLSLKSAAAPPTKGE